MLIFFAQISIAQPGSIKTEQYQAEFEKKQSIDVVSNYTDSLQYPIQILKIGINEELYEMYPELKDKRVGLGVANIVLEFLDMTNRFVFTEDKLEIKERMISQIRQWFLHHNSLRKSSALRAFFLPALINFISSTASLISSISNALASVSGLAFT
jgi:hypothetical protein